MCCAPLGGSLQQSFAYDTGFASCVVALNLLSGQPIDAAQKPVVCVEVRPTVCGADTCNMHPKSISAAAAEKMLRSRRSECAAMTHPHLHLHQPPYKTLHTAGSGRSASGGIDRGSHGGGSCFAKRSAAQRGNWLNCICFRHSGTYHAINHPFAYCRLLSPCTVLRLQSTGTLSRFMLRSAGACAQWRHRHMQDAVIPQAASSPAGGQACQCMCTYLSYAMYVNIIARQHHAGSAVAQCLLG